MIVSKKVTPFYLLALFAVILFAPKYAAASTLMGDEVTAELVTQLSDDWIVTPGAATISGATEFTIKTSESSSLDTFTIDIGESSIKIYSPGSINSSFWRTLTISDINWFGEPSRVISGFNLTLGTDWQYSSNLPVGIVESDISFTADSLSIELANGASWSRKNWILIDLQSTGPEEPPEVPEPSTALLLFIGLIGMAGLTRKSG